MKKTLSDRKEFAPHTAINDEENSLFELALLFCNLIINQLL